MFRRFLSLWMTGLALVAIPFAAESAARQDGGEAPTTAMADMGPDSTAMGRAEGFLMSQSSGTSRQPAAWPMPMVMTDMGGWSLMWMGQSFVAATQQSGPRGGDKVYSANWGMLGASRPAGDGSVILRGMISLEPLTVSDRVYPLLFQTGETAFGQPIVDGQHPHDLFMELAAGYARPLGDDGMFHVYYAAVGDPAIGPTAFPHRASAMETPQAVLSHHWQDSTHIANNVLTAGFSLDPIQIEASGFHGREPDENRWNIDYGDMDSWSARISVFPADEWQAQFSLGRLNEPELFHDGDVVRATASVQHIVDRGEGNPIATTLVWGRNYKTAEGEASHAVLAETLIPFAGRNFATLRFEWSQRDELFSADHDLEDQLEDELGTHTFEISALTGGYTRDILASEYLQVGIGASVSRYWIGEALEPWYGESPWGGTLFLRFRLREGS